MPQAELHDFIIELRSVSMGLGNYRQRFDHLAETHEKVAQAAAAVQSTENGRETDRRGVAKTSADERCHVAKKPGRREPFRKVLPFKGSSSLRVIPI